MTSRETVRAVATETTGTRAEARRRVANAEAVLAALTSDPSLRGAEARMQRAEAAVQDNVRTKSCTDKCMADLRASAARAAADADVVRRDLGD